MDKNNIIYSKLGDGTEINNIWNYICKQGVWALYGKKDLNSKYICLNVGKSVDIGREILYDVACMHFLTQSGNGTQEYINQFGEYQGFNSESGWTQEYLYPILDEYVEKIFVYVYDKSCSQHEKEFAWLTKAKYWRNGKAFTKEKDNYYEENKKEVLKDKTGFYEFESIGEILSKIKGYN